MNEERRTELAQLINEATQHRLSMTEALVLIDKMDAGNWLADHVDIIEDEPAPVEPVIEGADVPNEEELAPEVSLDS